MHTVIWFYLVDWIFRWSWMIFIIKGFRTIVFIFIVVSTTFSLICPPAFFRCLSNSGIYTKLPTPSFIESTGVACPDFISQPGYKCLLFLYCYSSVISRTHSVMVIGIGSLSFLGDNNLVVAGSILTTGIWLKVRKLILVFILLNRSEFEYFLNLRKIS